MSDKKTRLKAQLERKEESQDNSLQGKALERASLKKPPTTLTPHEWERWYKEHGIPASHRPNASKPKGWRRWLWWR